jgi:hypothetical protein
LEALSGDLMVSLSPIVDRLGREEESTYEDFVVDEDSLSVLISLISIFDCTIGTVVCFGWRFRFAANRTDAWRTD